MISPTLSLFLFFQLTSSAVPHGEALPAPEKSEFFFDKLFLRLDPSCLTHGNSDLSQHFSKVLQEASSSNGTYISSKRNHLNDLDEITLKNSNNEKLHWPNAEKFSLLLSDHLDAISRDFHASDLLAEDILLEPKPLHGRKLAEMSATERESKVIAALHLLAAVELVGEDKASQLIHLERTGDGEAVSKFITENSRPGAKIDAENLKALSSSKKRSTISSDEKDLTDAPAETGPLIIDNEKLRGLGIHIVRNPLLNDDILRLANLLPCLEFEAEPDRSKLALSDTFKPIPIFEDRETNLTSTDNEKIPVSTSQNSKGDDQDFLSAGSKTMMIPPDDVHFDKQWYLRSAVQGETFGAQIIDGWSSIMEDLRKKDRRLSANNTRDLADPPLDFKEILGQKGLTVAVLDSGCSRNPDLIHQFWRNEKTKGCNKDTFVGDGSGKPDDAGIKDDCVGYDFGNDRPDPTQEIEGRIHGSSTAGLIAAESNNKVGITGICPECSILCLKIYDTEKQKITMTSVIRALDYIARKGVKVSNHSYGGFGASNIEFAAHRSLNDKGHLSIASSGNNGCNIDVGSTDSNACAGEDGAPLGPFTPASYDIPSIISVGATTKDGKLAWFSNYGEKTIDVFAPGEDIITIYGADKLASVKGTSFSSPIVAGVAGLLWSHRPELNAEEIKELLLSTGIKVPELERKGRNPRIASLARALGADVSGAKKAGLKRTLEGVACLTLIGMIGLMVL